MGVVQVAPDVDCLFHALAYFDGYDGKVLRMDLANFMEQQAGGQAGLQAQWLQEVCHLRDNKWGGFLAIAAYSLMKGRRVMVHILRPELGTVQIQEMSHDSIYGVEIAPVVHLLYRDAGYFDALVELTDGSDVPSLGQQGASPQLPSIDKDQVQQLELSSLFAPIASYSQAYVASWTTHSVVPTITQEETGEMLRLAGWLLQLHCMPPPRTHQFRNALRTWQTMLRGRLGGRRLPWPWSFMVYGMIL